MQTAEQQSTDWAPAFGLRNRHVQSMLASMGIRKPVVRRRAKQVIEKARDLFFDCTNNVRMHGLLSTHGDRRRPLVALIHGWEGCADSLYLLSISGYLFEQGYDIFRLHLRDHGPTHHLNPEVFHAGRLDEVCEALEQMQHQVNPESWSLVGFSLGGNFSLRVGTQVSRFNLRMERVIGISALLNAVNTLWALEFGLPVYRGYFLKKWRRSINKKAQAYPERISPSLFCATKNLSGMTDYFVRNHTPFHVPKDYFNDYSVTGSKLADLQVPAYLILSEDDPVIPFRDISKIKANNWLNIIRSPYGGHCGFIENYRFDAWIDRYVSDLLSGTSSS